MNFSDILWAVPFLGIIFSMSLLPLLCPNFWHRYGSFVPAFWASVYLASVAYVFGAKNILPAIWEPLLEHYIPFILLISSLYITSGGIYVDFPRGRGPLFNVGFLLVGSMVAGWIGTTGAATLLIRPFLRANIGRKHKTHLLVFFIFLISNIGGAATPLGDPPLFIGFLEGVDFFWFLKNLGGVLLITTLLLCLLFFIVDSWFYREGGDMREIKLQEKRFVFKGTRNLLLLALILLTVILCNSEGNVEGKGIISYPSLIRNILLVIISLVSLKITPKEIRERNHFSFAPMREVAELFAGIFVTVIPLIHMLHKGPAGELKWVFDWIAPAGTFMPDRCFWASGLLSSILDNAPTFLIFFHLTSGDPQVLMTTKSCILTAISIATVFMGALTYIGNAPNLMVKSIADGYGLKAPSFVGYMVWSISILGPVFFMISLWLQHAGT
ncbi:MAG: sodium:proton antiporter [Holosporaceae bacterium]|jgi:Na+/H+ antiporter NhaD/arsenite permease-like protein|nr:sodium:proton antiporter [Holosporaceae bacterium]